MHRAALRTILLALLPVLLGACVLGSRTVRYSYPEDAVVGYRATVTGTVSTQLPDGTASLDKVRIAMDLESLVARVFRDETRGILIKVVEFDGEVGEGDSLQTIARDEVVGRGIVLRALPSGEVFRVMGTENLTGVERRGQLWNHALSALLFRLPATHWEGEGGPAYLFTLRVPLTETARVDREWRLKYTASERLDCEGERCYRFHYEAVINEAGEDVHPEFPATLRGEGSAAGSILWRHRDGALLEHRYTFGTERKVLLGPPGVPGRPAAVNRLNTEVVLKRTGIRRSAL